jgi:hypothetical protein
LIATETPFVQVVRGQSGAVKARSRFRSRPLNPIENGWSGHVKDIYCQSATPPFDYACTAVNYGTIRNARTGHGDSLFKVGVIDVHGHAVTGQQVGVNDPLGPPPPAS